MLVVVVKRELVHKKRGFLFCTTKQRRVLPMLCAATILFFFHFMFLVTCNFFIFVLGIFFALYEFFFALLLSKIGPKMQDSFIFVIFFNCAFGNYQSCVGSTIKRMETEKTKRCQFDLLNPIINPLNAVLTKKKKKPLNAGRLLAQLSSELGNFPFFYYEISLI